MTGVSNFGDEWNTKTLRHKQIHEFYLTKVGWYYYSISSEEITEQDHHLRYCTLTRVNARDFKI